MKKTLMAKTCEVNCNSKCIARKNKDAVCCLQDIKDNALILQPIIDSVEDLLGDFNHCKTVLSKMFYMISIYNPQCEVEKDFLNEAKFGMYLGYTELTHDIAPLLAGLVKDTLRWFKCKVLQSCNITEEEFLISFKNDVYMIQSLAQPVHTECSMDLDDMFF